MNEKTFYEKQVILNILLVFGQENLEKIINGYIDFGFIYYKNILIDMVKNILQKE